MKKVSLAVLFMATIVFASCSKEDEKSPEIILEKDNVVLTFGDEYLIKATSDYDLTYKSEDENHAMVDEKGLVKATFVGETNIVVSNTEQSKKVKITVRPEYDLYDDPSPYLGMTKSQVISKLGEPTATTEKTIGYSNYSKYADALMLSIQDDMVSNIMVTVDISYASKLAKFLGERYYYLGQQNDVYTYVNNIDISKANTAIVMSVFSKTYFGVMYMKYQNK